MTDTPQLSELFSSFQATLKTEERVRKTYDRELTNSRFYFEKQRAF